MVHLNRSLRKNWWGLKIAKKRETYPKWFSIFLHQNLKDFDTERESVISLLRTLDANDLAPRVQTFYKTDYACEVSKDCEHIAYLKINGKGELFYCKREKQTWTIDTANSAGKWKKMTEAEFILGVLDNERK